MPGIYGCCYASLILLFCDGGSGVKVFSGSIILKLLLNEGFVMRCPKCAYISFDHVTSCAKCSTDLAELASTLKGTAFRSLNTFFLGSLVAEYADDSAAGMVVNAPLEDSEVTAFEDFTGVEGLELTEDDFADMGDLPDLEDSDDLGVDFNDSEDLSLDMGDLNIDDLDVSDVDLDSVGYNDTEEDEDSDLSLDDVDLAGVDFDDIESEEEELAVSENDMIMVGNELEDVSFDDDPEEEESINFDDTALNIPIEDETDTDIGDGGVGFCDAFRFSTGCRCHCCTRQDARAY